MTRIVIKVIELKDRLVKGTKRFFRSNEEGATEVEYGLLIALVAFIIIVAVHVVGQHVSTGFNTVATNRP
jgi:pilus assembly protein Flp/PilA